MPESPVACFRFLREIPLLRPREPEPPSESIPPWPPLRFPCFLPCGQPSPRRVLACHGTAPYNAPLLSSSHDAFPSRATAAGPLDAPVASPRRGRSAHLGRPLRLHTSLVSMPPRRGRSALDRWELPAGVVGRSSERN